MALTGVKVLELAGLAPASFCGMLLADFGATVIKVDRLGSKSELDLLSNGKKSIAIDLKKDEGKAIFKDLCNDSDVLLESYRVGVMENLKLGPEILTKENPRMIYARLSGYGQVGSYASHPSHDINVLALSGVLSMMKRKGEKPTPPVNLIGGLGGGSVMCAFGILAALYERAQSGKGQVVDGNMVSGTAYLSSWFFRSQKLSMWQKPQGENILECGTHYYETYQTKDGKFIAVGNLESEFYNEFIKILNLDPITFNQQGDLYERKRIIQEIFLEKTQKEWSKIFDGRSTCVTPVLCLDDVDEHSQNKCAETFQRIDDVLYPNPAPKLNRTPAVSNCNNDAPEIGQNSFEILKTLGYTERRITELAENNIIKIISK